MGVPDPFRDSSLLREHAYYDTGDVDYVIPPSDSNKKMGFMSIRERGLGNFDYSSSRPLYSGNSETEVTAGSLLLYISCILMGVLVVFTIVSYIIKSSPKETLAIKSTLNNIVKKRSRSNRKLKGILPMSHTPDSNTPPSLTSTPELSDVESFESPSRNFKFDTIVDDFLHTLKSWTVNEFELDNLRVH